MSYNSPTVRRGAYELLVSLFILSVCINESLNNNSVTRIIIVLLIYYLNQYLLHNAFIILYLCS
jgi:hypothetical protein